ncbi:MAG: type IV pilus biogenesis/stability protein PilW [Hydrogenophilales bacterium]|nr:type IV pilus biogenesis/stability protein PilW [Hydrogenophilales bacterium]
MMRFLVILLMFLLAGCAQNPSTDSGDAAASGRTGRGLPGTDTYRVGRAILRGQYSVALAEIKEALAIDPAHAPAYNVLALVHAKLREDRQAEESFRKAMDLAPNYSEVRNNFGYFLCQRQRYAEALPFFDAALMNPLYVPGKSLANAGLCALHKGDLALAENYLQRAMAHARNQPTALLGMAELEMRQRNVLAARAHFTRLAEQNEFKPQMLWLGVRIERALGNRESEASYGAQLRRNHPETVETRRLLEGQYDMMGTMP